MVDQRRSGNRRCFACFSSELLADPRHERGLKRQCAVPARRAIRPARGDDCRRMRRAGFCFPSLTTGLLRPLACGGLAALIGIVATQGASAQANPPTLIEIVPASGPAGPAYPLPATIRGTGFLPTGNVVRFGPVTVPAEASPDGSRIMFYVPKAMPSRGEVPPAGLTPGDYPVTVTNPAGTSNALSFRLTHGP
jgi:hypothetical protein